MKTDNYLIIAACVLFFSALLLPYMYYDIAEAKSFFDFSPRRIIYRDIHVNGIQTGLSFLPTVWLIFPLSRYMNNSTRSTARGVFISGLIVFVLHALLYFALTADPSFYHGYVNVRPAYGFWVNTLGSVLLTVGSFKLMRNMDDRKRVIHSDLLDDTI